MISKHGGKKAELRRSEWLWTLNVPPRRRHRGGVHSTEIARSGNSAQPPLVSIRLLALVLCHSDAAVALCQVLVAFTGILSRRCL